MTGKECHVMQWKLTPPTSCCKASVGSTTSCNCVWWVPVDWRLLRSSFFKPVLFHTYDHQTEEAEYCQHAYEMAMMPLNMAAYVHIATHCICVIGSLSAVKDMSSGKSSCTSRDLHQFCDFAMLTYLSWAAAVKLSWSVPLRSSAS